MTSFHVPLPRGWNAERTRQLIAMYRFSRSSGEFFVVPAGAGVDRFPGAVPASASLANLKAREKTRQHEKDQQSDRLPPSFAAVLCGH